MISLVCGYIIPYILNWREVGTMAENFRMKQETSFHLRGALITMKAVINICVNK